MSIRLWKAVLYPGRQRTADGRWFTQRPEDNVEAMRNCKRMVSRGIRVPCVWEHQLGANPVQLSRGDRLANYVKHCFAEIGDAKVDRKNVLWLAHDVYDPKDADKLKTTEMQVSPKLFRNGFSDSRGGEYPGCVVGHVAATPTPVQYWQDRGWHERPFELSNGTALFLSYGDSKMAKDKDEKEAPEVEAPPEVEETGADEQADQVPVGGPEAELAGLVDALREYGINIPEECEDIKHIIIAIKAAKGSKTGDEDMNATVGGEQTQQGQGPPMMMSDQRAAAKYADAQRKGMKADVRELYLTGRIGRMKRLELARKIDAVELSFYETGDLTPNHLVEQIKGLGELAPNTAWKPTGNTTLELSNTEIEEPPELLSKNSAGTAEATAAILSRIPGPKAAA